MSTAYGPHDQDGGQTPAGGDGAAAGQEAQQWSWPQPGYTQPYGPGSIPPPPPPMWPGYQGFPPGGGPYGGPGPEVQHAGKRRRGKAIAAGVAAVAIAAAGGAWVAAGSGAAPLSAAQIAAKVDPGLVDVTSSVDFGRATAAGTGMVLTSSGEVLTNNHVVAGATSVKVRDIGNGRTYTARVVGYDDTSDVAVLQLVGASGLATVPIGNSGGVSAGDQVVALGNAEGRGGVPAEVTGSVTSTGNAITAVDDGDGVKEHLTGMIRTDADIQPGDSGGPLVNSSGQVIGMDTAASSSNSAGVGTTADQSTAAFSIPINRAIGLAHQITAGQSSATVHIGATAFLGVEISSQFSGGQATSGVLIGGTVQGTAAASAGLAGGDAIQSVGGHQVTSASDLQQVIERYHPGDKVSVTWTTPAGQPQSATVTLTAGPTG
jgi:S1-C subfamily serine protease